MKSKNTVINQIHLLHLETLALCKKYNINEDCIEIVETIPNHVYTNNNYVSNGQYMNSVVYCQRSIKIKSDMTVKYKCPLVTNQLENKNIFSPNLWEELKNNAKNIGICTYSKRNICPIFCYKIK